MHALKTSARALLLVASFLAGIGPAQAQQPTLSVGTNLVDISQIKGNETDPSAAISFLNPSNLFVVAAMDGTVPGLFVASSTNFGATWATNLIATNTTNAQGLIPAYGEPSVAWDTFGNLFIAYLPATFEGVAVAISTNGGASFAVFTNLAALDSTDTPRITTAATGIGAGSVWVVYKDYSISGTPLLVQGLQSTGLGTNGVFGVMQVLPGSGAGGFPDVVAGPSGQVMVAFQGNLSGSGPSPISISVNTNAISTNGFGTNFLAPVLAASNAIGGFTYVPAESTGIGLNATPGLAWDGFAQGTNFGKAYLVYTGFGPNSNLIIETCLSTNSGASWSAPTQVDDDLAGSNDHFLPRVAVDPATGILGFSWLDCRNDNGSATPPKTTTATKTYTFSSGAISNIVVIATNSATNNNSVVYTIVDNSGGAGTNWSVTISGNNLGGTSLASDGASNIFVYGGSSTNFDVSLTTTTNGGGSKVTVSVTNIMPNAFSTGNASNQVAIGYTTVSLDGGQTFLGNQPLVSLNRALNSPSVSYGSIVSGSRSLTGWGHYTALAAFGGNFFPVWPDNSDILTNNPDGAWTNFDLYGVAGGTNGSVTVPNADLSIFVTYSPSLVVSDQPLTYAIIVSNNGPMAGNNVVVTNTLSPSVQFPAVTPAAGASYAIFGSNVVFSMPAMPAHTALTNTIRVNPLASAIATNFASVYGPLIDLVPANNTNQLVVVISGMDLALGMTTSETNLLINDTVVNTITVTNLGPSTNQSVFITNTYSLNWTNFTVQSPGGYYVSNNITGVITTNFTITITTNITTNTTVTVTNNTTNSVTTYTTNSVTNNLASYITNNMTNILVVMDLGLLATNQPVTAIVTATILGGGPNATNSAMVTSQDVDTNLSNNSATITYSVNSENLAIGVATPPTANLGVPFPLTVSVTNFGLSYSGPVIVSNLLPTNLALVSVGQSQGTYALTSSTNGNLVLFSLGALDANQTATLNLSAVAMSGPASATIASAVTSANFDSFLTNNTTVNKVVIQGEDLGLSISASPVNVQVGQLVTYTEIVTNSGPSANGNVFLTNTLSAKLGQITVLQPATNYTITSNTVVFNLGAIAAQQSVPVTLTATALSTGSGTNTGGVGSLSFDTNLVNNTARFVIPIIATQPMISNIVVTPQANGAFISFRTGFPATAQVQYGLTTAYGTVTSLNPAPSTSHVFLLTGLARDTLYDFNILAWVGPTLYTTNGSFTTTNTLILNTPDASYAGIWTATAAGTGIFGSYYQTANTTAGNATASAVYTPNIPVSGNYNVSVWFPIGANFTTNAQVVITGATNAIFVSVNQTTNGGGWLPLVNDLFFTSGTSGNVTIYNNTGETNKNVVANAMKWAYDPAQDNPTNGSVPASWASFYFGANLNVSGSADPDQDGYSNYAEFVFGTDPTSASSFLNFSATFGPGNLATLVFSPWQGGRAYQLQTSTNLAGGWVTLTNTATVNTNGYGVFTVTQGNPSAAFYRLSAQIPSP